MEEPEGIAARLPWFLQTIHPPLKRAAHWGTAARGAEIADLRPVPGKRQGRLPGDMPQPTLPKKSGLMNERKASCSGFSKILACFALLFVSAHKFYAFALYRAERRAYNVGNVNPE